MQSTLSHAAAAAASIGLLGVVAAGCGHGSGSQVPPTAPHNMTVENDASREIDVYVDGGRIGDARPGELAFFSVARGLHDVEVREEGEAFRHDLGAYRFDDLTVVDVYWGDDLAENLVVENDDVVTVHVYLDDDEVGSVRPGETVGFRAAPGAYEVYLRERGETFRDYVGTFDLHDASEPPVVLVHQ